MCSQGHDCLKLKHDCDGKMTFMGKEGLQVLAHTVGGAKQIILRPLIQLVSLSDWTRKYTILYCEHEKSENVYIKNIKGRTLLLLLEVE